MKLTKTQLQKLIKEELSKANDIARKILSEGDIFSNQNRLLPSEWNKFKKNFLSKNSNHKVVSGKDGSVSFEAIVDKSQPRKAIIKYIPDDMTAMHDLKAARFFDYIR